MNLMTTINKTAIWKIIAAICLLIAIFSPLTNNREIAAESISYPASFNWLAEKVSPAVVNIRTVKIIKNGGPVFRHFHQSPWGKDDPFNDFFKRFFGDGQQQEYKQRSLGSGFIIDEEGYIVTNNHVIEGADEIKVKLNNGKEYDAEIMGRDPNTDLALIKIKSRSDFPFVVIGDSDNLKVGEWVVAIGSPFGLEHTVTAGIVSAKGRVIGSGPYDDFIQTDASINPGNSGGPLLNMKGEVIGINTAIIAGGNGIGFAVPVNIAKNIIDQLKTEGEVTRGWLGVAIQDVSEEMSEYYKIKEKKGALVADVFEGNPADNAGIKVMDIILEINGKNIETSRQLTRTIADLKVGETVKIKVLRDGIEKMFKVKIAKRDDKSVASAKTSNDKHEEEEDIFGITVSDLIPEIARRFKIIETKGLIVVGVESGSKGYDADVRVGDLIKEVNHQPTETVEDFKAAIEKIKEGESVQLFIQRINVGFLVLKLTK